MISLCIPGKIPEEKRRLDFNNGIYFIREESNVFRSLRDGGNQNDCGLLFDGLPLNKDDYLFVSTFNIGGISFIASFLLTGGNAFLKKAVKDVENKLSGISLNAGMTVSEKIEVIYKTICINSGLTLSYCVFPFSKEAVERDSFLLSILGSFSTVCPVFCLKKKEKSQKIFLTSRANSVGKSKYRKIEIG